MKRDMKFEVTYRHASEKVWRALTDPAAIAQWLMKNDFEARVGHKSQFKTQARLGWRCELRSSRIEPPRRQVYTWCGGNLNTTVSGELQSIAEGPRLRLEHAGFRGLRGWMLSCILGKGWRSKILTQNIPALLLRWSADGPVPGIPEAHCAHN